MAHRDDLPLRLSTLKDAPALLARSADMLSTARSVASLRAAVTFSADLWRDIARLLPAARVAGLNDAQRRTLHEHATYVAAICAPEVCPDDNHIEVFITLARRDSAWLANAVAPTVTSSAA